MTDQLDTIIADGLTAAFDPLIADLQLGKKFLEVQMCAAVVCAVAALVFM